MNGPLQMYRTKPFVQHDTKDISLPTCMYKLKNIHETRNGMVAERSLDHVSSPKKNLDIFDQNNQDIPGMASLEARQQQILNQLAELKKQMLSIKANLKITTNEPSSVTSTCTANIQPIKLKEHPDIVINCSPQYPPYSLLVIQKLWRSQLYVNVKSFIHSSVASLTPEAQSLVSALENFEATCTAPELNIRLIWKDVGSNTELIVSRLPFIGEVNILRYLARISSDNLNYELTPNPHEIDSLLDTCYRITISKTKTERAGLLQVLNKSLGKSQWLAGRSSISIADLAAYSALKQACQNETNVNVGKWLQRIECVS